MYRPALIVLCGCIATVSAQQPANPTFDVASIKRNKQAEADRAAVPVYVPVVPGRAQTLPGGLLRGRGMSVRELIRDAYSYRNRAQGDIVTPTTPTHNTAAATLVASAGRARGWAAVIAWTLQPPGHRTRKAVQKKGLASGRLDTWTGLPSRGGSLDRTCWNVHTSRSNCTGFPAKPV